MSNIMGKKVNASVMIKPDGGEGYKQCLRQSVIKASLGIGGGLLLFWLAIFLKPQGLYAQGTINWPRISLTRKASGLSQPTHITNAGDGSNRLFVVEQQGRIRIIKNGVLLSTPFLDITDRVISSYQQGLLSVAFPSDYASEGYFYVAYTRKSDGDSVLARYHVTSNPDLANPSSEKILLTNDQPTNDHNIGQIAFGPDGYLYIGIGDGHIGDPDSNAQNTLLLLGKILRIDVNGDDFPADPNRNYAIPSDNPFVDDPGVLDEIWVLGFRNPWRFSFDRQTGGLYIGETGQHKYEEVDFQSASSAGGENYGWNIMEGAHCYNSTTCDQTGLTLPVTEYTHPSGPVGGCTSGAAIVGGFVYRGATYARMKGVYFFGDYCNGQIRGLKHDGTAWRSTLLTDTAYVISTFGEDEAGNLYLVNYKNGNIYLVQDTSCDGLLATMVGTASNNVINGTPNADVISGLGGGDTINGLGGNDRICGGGGNDTLNGDSGDDRLFGQNGTDTLNGGDGSDTCNGGNGSDTSTSCESKTSIP